jgi:hypothetical protein
VRIQAARRRRLDFERSAVMRGSSIFLLNFKENVAMSENNVYVFRRKHLRAVDVLQLSLG